MALIPSITAPLNKDGQSFKFTELTGVYDVTSNPGGYGSPNPTAGTSTGALVVKDLTNNVTYDSITITPSDSDGITYITEALLQVSTVAISNIPDGIWSFTYTVTNSSVDYTTEYRTLVIKSINCKMTDLSLKYADKSCNCCNNRSFRELFVEAHALYASLCAAVTCGNVAQINEQITFLDNFLNDLNCKNC
jgi:hypothetical protein